MTQHKIHTQESWKLKMNVVLSHEEPDLLLPADVPPSPC